MREEQSCTLMQDFSSAEPRAMSANFPKFSRLYHLPSPVLITQNSVSEMVLGGFRSIDFWVFYEGEVLFTFQGK